MATKEIESVWKLNVSSPTHFYCLIIFLYSLFSCLYFVSWIGELNCDAWHSGLWFLSLELASVIPHISPYFLFIEAIKFLFILPNFILINFLLILLKKRKEKCKVNFCIFSWKPYQCTCIPLSQWVIFLVYSGFLPTFLLMPSYLLPVFLVSTMIPSFCWVSTFLLSQSHPHVDALPIPVQKADKLTPHNNKISSYYTPVQENSLKVLLLMGTTVFLVFTSISDCFLLK